MIPMFDYIYTLTLPQRRKQEQRKENEGEIDKCHIFSF